MVRTLTLKELVFEELNRQLAQEGRDVRVVAERPKPRLAAKQGEVVKLRKVAEVDRKSNVEGLVC
jgi:hypothetical protein